MARDDEAYIHFQECISSLNSAWRIIGQLQEERISGQLSSAAYHMAIIEYSKPYKISNGTKRKHRLQPPSLSDEDMKLHTRLIELRDTVLAHSDLGPKDAKVYLGELAGKPFPLIIQNTAPVLPAMAAVRSLIERTLDQLYGDLSGFEKHFQDAP